MSEESVKIGTSGNTAGPCYFAIKAKGYEINVISTTTLYTPGDLKYQFDAIKGALFFSASSPEELLGLINMWELRKENWQMNPEEKGIYKTVLMSTPMYDENDNLIEDE